MEKESNEPFVGSLNEENVLENENEDKNKDFPKGCKIITSLTIISLLLAILIIIIVTSNKEQKNNNENNNEEGP